MLIFQMTVNFSLNSLVCIASHRSLVEWHHVEVKINSENCVIKFSYDLLMAKLSSIDQI